MTEDELRGKFLTKLRLDKNLKQSDLAKMIGYSDKSISKWERGKCFPKDTEILIKLANIFDVSIDELLQGEYSDIEEKNVPHSNNKFLNFILKNRIILIIVFIIFILLIIGYYYFIIDFKSTNNLLLNGGSEIENFESNSSKNIIYSDDSVNSSSDLHTADSNRSGIKNNYDKLLDEGFTYQNFIYYKYINHDTKIDYYLINDSIKVYIHLNSDELIILNNSNEYNDIVMEKYVDDNLEYFYINNEEIKNCNIEKCETYLDYAMYINYIKNLILN